MREFGSILAVLCILMISTAGAWGGGRERGRQEMCGVVGGELMTLPNYAPEGVGKPFKYERDACVRFRFASDTSRIIILGWLP